VINFMYHSLGAKDSGNKKEGTKRDLLGRLRMAKVDVNGDGKLDVDEFIALFENVSVACQGSLVVLFTSHRSRTHAPLALPMPTVCCTCVRVLFAAVSGGQPTVGAAVERQGQRRREPGGAGHRDAAAKGPELVGRLRRRSNRRTAHTHKHTRLWLHGLMYIVVSTGFQCHLHFTPCAVLKSYLMHMYVWSIVHFF